jgi:hypothetical protein
LTLKDFKYTPSLDLIDDANDLEVFTSEELLKPVPKDCLICGKNSIATVQLADYVFSCCSNCEKELLGKLAYELMNGIKCSGLRALLWNPCLNAEQLQECTKYVEKLGWNVGVTQMFVSPGEWTAAAVNKASSIFTTSDTDMMVALCRAAVMVMLVFESGRKKEDESTEGWI